MVLARFQDRFRIVSGSVAGRCDVLGNQELAKLHLNGLRVFITQVGDFSVSADISAPVGYIEYGENHREQDAADDIDPFWA